MTFTQQMMIEEARNFMKEAPKIRADKPMTVKQQRIVLAETGTRFETEAITNRREFEKLCHVINDAECFEKFTIVAVNAQCKPIGMYSISGSLSEVSAYPRVVVTYALLTNAHSVFFTHNHPGGTCAPSSEDIRSTLELQNILAKLGIFVLDHLITTPEGGSYSMAQHGDIQFSRNAI